jgi:hypothetical protein
MTPQEQHAAVLAQLDRLIELGRAAAEEAGPGPWHAVPDIADNTADVLGPDHSTVIYNEGTVTIALAEHLAAQHPNTVLAQLAGRRRIIERHAPTVMDGVDGPWCGCCRPTAARWPCDTYRDAAADLLPDE